ncbi:MAG TPA: NAD(P)H-hydrate epimerase, partial [Ktedonobacteraceae bacterium]|nr:NAD(P)H-hydrate epimerase [Ktedonobacteraceae bacterium]
MHIVTVDEMRELEARADKEYHLTSHILMENAGRSAAEIIAHTIVQNGKQHSLEHLKFLLLIGPGNNGGDGLVVARYLEQWGAYVSLYRWKEQRLTVRGRELAEEETPTALEHAIQQADYVIDAILGTGHSRPLPDSMRTLLGRVEQERAQRPALHVIAIDLPTGLNADTGEIDPGTLRADTTITLACPKQGFFFFPGRDYTGMLYVGDIGLPAELEA